MTDNPQNDLLIAGARDFFKASIAIREFGEQVYQAGLRALIKREGELQRVLGVAVSRDNAQTYPSPKGYIPRKSDGTSAFLGLRVQLPAYREFCLYGKWTMSNGHRNDEICSAVACLGLSKVSAAETLAGALLDHRCDGSPRQESYWVWIEKFLKPEEFIGLESHFVGLIDRWITYSEAVGGLARYFQ